MARRLAPAAALAALVLVAPAAGDNSGKIATLHAKIAAAQRHEAALNAQIVDVTSQIRILERQVGGVSQRLSLLQRDLELHQRRLDKLNALFTFETQRLVFLRSQYQRVLNLLSRRLIDIYESHGPSTFDVLLNSKSIEDAVRQLRYLKAIALQDHALGGPAHDFSRKLFELCLEPCRGIDGNATDAVGALAARNARIEHTTRCRNPPYQYA